MPYTMGSTPERIKKIPEKARRIWISAFNAAFKQYNGNEAMANKIAWSAVKKAGYKEVNGVWKRWE